MMVLHAHWQPPVRLSESGNLFFWSERSASPQPEKLDRRRKRARPHPFAAAAAEVRMLLKRLTGLDLPGQFEPATLNLPTGRYGPQPSPGLIHDWDLSGDTAPALLPWEIPAVKLAPADGFYALLHLPDGVELPADVRLGDDVRFWQVTVHLVLEVLAQQKVLPALDPAGDGGGAFHAHWTPVLDGPRDGPRLARLRQSMPPLCRADAALETEPSPQFLLDTFLGEVSDGLARRWGRPADWNDAPGTEPVQDWLRALLRDTRMVHGPAAQLGRIHASYRAWLRNLHVAGDRHFRVAFRMEAPAQQNGRGSDAWTLHFLLQARDDPSLLVTADVIWRSRGTVLPALDRRLDNPQEKLLAGLGYTARLFAPLRRSLDSKHPSRATLTGSEAFTFLRDVAPLLEESGFGVLVPPWWNQPGTRLGVRLRMSGQGNTGGEGVASGLVSMENLINYRWELSLGGETLNREEFEALVQLKSPLVQIRGQWVQLDPDQIEAAIHFWEKVDQAGTVGLLDALQMGLGSEAVDGLPVEGVDFEGWLDDWMARFTQQESLDLLPEPQRFNATLRPYQHYGYSWLDFQRRWGIGAILADDMGLGKTIQTLAMLQRIKEDAGELPGPVLLICPTSVVVNWAKETDRFTPDLNLLVHQGPNRLQAEAFVAEAGKMDVVATSFALVRRDGDFLKQVDWFGVVLDEAQNIKNPETKQARTIRSIPADFRLALTGTPVENRLSELWSIMHFLNPGFLGSQQKFRQHFALPIERYDDETAARRLRQLASPFILRRVKTDPTVIQDLPEKQETKAYCTLSEEQATLYEAVVREALQAIAESDGVQRRGMVLAMLMKLKQICNHPAQFLHQAAALRMGGRPAVGDGYTLNGEEKRSGKLARTVELLEELLPAGERMLIFTQFSEMGHLLRGFLQQRFGVPVLFLYGGTPAQQRSQMVERFQEDPDGPPLFVLSLKAGGTGLNLTRANHVLHFDRWWNPAVEDQATDRAFRIGQKRNVQVHKYVCVGTLEEKIDEMIERKKALAESIIGNDENWLTELSTDDLRDLVTLRREMIA